MYVTVNMDNLVIANNNWLFCTITSHFGQMVGNDISPTTTGQCAQYPVPLVIVANSLSEENIILDLFSVLAIPRARQSRK